jgi:hypothetical protein
MFCLFPGLRYAAPLGFVVSSLQDSEKLNASMVHFSNNAAQVTQFLNTPTLSLYPRHDVDIAEFQPKCPPWHQRRLLAFARHAAPRRTASRSDSSPFAVPITSCHVGLATGRFRFSNRETRSVSSAIFCSNIFVLMAHFGIDSTRRQ